MGIVAAGIGIFLALYLSGVLFMNHTNRLDTSRTGGTILLDTVIVLYACYKVYGREEVIDKKKEARPKKKKETKKSKKPPEPQPQKEEPPRKPVIPSQPVNQQPKPAMPKQLQETEGKKPVYRLIAKKGSNAQQFLLYKSPYVVGKSHEQVDGVIYSDAVSKVHAEFIEEQGRLYVVDMSSTNGTYVNEKKIASNQRIAVRGGDRIQIADKEYLLSS